MKMAKLSGTKIVGQDIDGDGQWVNFLILLRSILDIHSQYDKVSLDLIWYHSQILLKVAEWCWYLLASSMLQLYI